MRSIQGIPVSPGIAIREAFILDSEDYPVDRRLIAPEEVPGELDRFDKALEQAREAIELEQVRYTADLGPEVSLIFRAQRQMLHDDILKEEIRTFISDSHFTPEYATSHSIRKYVKLMEKLQGEHFAQRALDFYDIERRILRHLVGEKREGLKSFSRPVILVARNLTPAQTAGLDPNKVVGFVTDAGGRTSHTAIVARQLGIPAVVGLASATADIANGDLVIIDGARGVVIIDPDEPTQREYRQSELRFLEFERTLAELKDLPAETIDGLEIALNANIEFPEEIPTALSNGACGIGLYRTEFLFMDMGSRVPDEEAHFLAYKKAVEELEGRPLVVRTLDLGGDKFSQSSLGPEKNPFLGCRSIRLCFERLDLFMDQLRAILRAAALGNVSILLPMVATLHEVKTAKELIQEAREDLDKRGVPFRADVPVGLMIEVPSAAMTADILAREVDFFSIGTNDLVQYSLAVDRGNPKVAKLYQPAHPAILRMLRTVIEAGRRHGIKVSMCGEMSGEVLYTIPLIGMGLTDFSIGPGSIPEVKKVIRSISFREATQVVKKIFTFDDAPETDEYLREKARRIIPQLF